MMQLWGKKPVSMQFSPFPLFIFLTFFSFSKVKSIRSSKSTELILLEVVKTLTSYCNKPLYSWNGFPDTADVHAAVDLPGPASPEDRRVPPHHPQVPTSTNVQCTGWPRSYRKSVLLFCVSVLRRLRDLQYRFAVTSGSPSTLPYHIELISK